MMDPEAEMDLEAAQEVEAWAQDSGANPAALVWVPDMEATKEETARKTDSICIPLIFFALQVFSWILRAKTMVFCFNWLMKE